MTISSINPNVAAAPALAGATATPSASESESRFLKLLVTQLNNQDPLNPLDNAQLTSQLAQMSTVSGVEKLNGTVESLLAQSGSNQVLQSASLIGRTVLVPGTEIGFNKGSSTPFGVDLPSTADSVKVTITNSAGATVRTIDVGGLAPGVKNLSWDGSTDSGNTAPDGAYTFQVTATAAGSPVASTALAYATVGSVAQNAGSVTLDLGAGRTAVLGDIRKII